MNIEEALDIRLSLIFPKEILGLLKEQGLYEPILSGKVKDAVTMYEYFPSKFLRWSYAKLTDFSIEILPYLVEGPVLEIACGRGNLLVELVQKGVTPIYGIDASSMQLDVAKKRLQKYSEELYLFNGRAEEFDYGGLPKMGNIIMREFWGMLSSSNSAKLLEGLKNCLMKEGQIIIGPHINIEYNYEIKEAYRVLEEQLGFVLDYEPDYEFEKYGFSKKLISLDCGEKHYILKPI